VKRSSKIVVKRSSKILLPRSRDMEAFMLLDSASRGRILSRGWLQLHVAEFCHVAGFSFTWPNFVSVGRESRMIAEMLDSRRVAAQLSASSAAERSSFIIRVESSWNSRQAYGPTLMIR